MTEYQIASAILNYVTSHEGVTNFPVNIDQIREEVDTLRMRIFDETDIASNYTMPLEFYLQTIETKDTSYDADNKITTVEVPLIHIRTNGKVAIRYCGGPNDNIEYRVISGNHNKTAKFDRWIGSAPTAHYRNGVIKFYGSWLKKVRLEAVFIDPSEKTGYDFKSERYPVPNNIADHIIGKTINSYIRTTRREVAQPNTQSDIPIARNAGS